MCAKILSIAVYGVVRFVRIAMLRENASDKTKIGANKIRNRERATKARHCLPFVRLSPVVHRCSGSVVNHRDLPPSLITIIRLHPMQGVQLVPICAVRPVRFAPPLIRTVLLRAAWDTLR
jgi:hypothetical protein